MIYTEVLNLRAKEDMVNPAIFMIRQLNKKDGEFNNDLAYTHYKNINKVWDILRRLKQETSADRCWVLSCWYYNKNKKICGLRGDGIWYGDFELIDKFKISSKIDQYQKVPVGVLWNEWKMAEEDGYNEIYNVITYKGLLNKTIHVSRGAFSYYGAGIFVNNKLVGVIGCDWAHQEAYGYTEVCSVEMASTKIRELIRSEDCCCE